MDVGQNNLSVAIPAGAATGTTFARFRLSSDGGLQSTGLAADGEVEDYSVNLSEANQAPVATDNNYSIEADGVLTVAASGILADDTDANGDSLSAVLVGDVVNGVLSLSGDGAFTYQPNAGYVGTDTFTYLAIDGDLTSNLATVTIDVYAVSTLSIEATQQGSETDGSATIFTLTRTGYSTASLEAHVILQGTAQPGVDYTAPAGLGENNTLTVTFDAGSDTATLSLPALSDNVIDSYETVLALLQPGSYSVQPGADRALGVIAGEDVEAFPEHFVAFDLSQSDTSRTLSNGVFAMLRSDGSIETWGDSTADEYSELTAGTPTGGGFTQIYSNNFAFAALHADGSVATWGHSEAGGDPGTLSSALEAEVVHVIPFHYGFTAIKSDGEVVTWGDISGFAYLWATAATPPAQLNNITKLCSTAQAFAALTEDGTIEAWGAASYGGAEYITAPPSGSGFTDIVAGFHHFAALREDGSIVVWGGTEQSPWADARVNAPTDDGYIQIIANGNLSFAALKADGSITIWGVVNNSPPGNGYTQIIPGRESFAAIHADGSIYSSLSGSPSGNDFTQVIANTEAYAAIKADGTVVTWGNVATGGDSASVAGSLVDVMEIAHTQHAFAALRVDGTVVTWGDSNYGGDSSSVASNLTNVTHLYAIDNAFAARRADGSVVSWGASGNLTGNPTEAGLVAHATPKWNDRLTFGSFLTLSTGAISEGAGAGAATGTVTRTGDLSGDLVVSLESSDTSEATVPATVTIAAGQVSASFSIDAVNDITADLIQPVAITAQVAGEYYGLAVLNVVDDGDGALFIDDGDAGYASNVSPITITDQGYQDDYQWILATTPDSPYYIEYEASDIGAGNYEIATTWQTQTEVSAFARHTAVQYEIYDGQTLVDTVTVDQQQAPAADYTAGGESFEIIAPDVAIASDTLRVRILIQAPGTGSSNYRTLSADAVRIALVPEGPNDAPVFADQVLSVAENSTDGTVIGTLVATDADGDPLTYAITTNVDPDSDGNDAFRIEGDQLLVNDADDFDYEANTQLVITARASDGSLADTAQITVNVTDLNENPVAIDDTYQVLTNADLTVDAPGVLGNDTDAEGDTLTAVLVSSTSNGTLSFNADGSFAYQPDSWFEGIDTFTYRVNDGVNDSDNVAAVRLEVSKLRYTLDNPNTLQGREFGASVATDGNYILVGAPDNNLGSSYIYTDGQAYLFDAATGNLLHTFNPPDGTSNDWDKFGYTVALDGNRVLIGDPNRNVGGDDYVGRAYLYDAITGDLVRTIDDPAPAYNGRFASAVAIDGNHILIGNHQHAVPDGDGGTETVGEAYLIDATTGALLHTLNAPANTPNYAFGVSVAIEGDRILIGSADRRFG